MFRKYWALILGCLLTAGITGATLEAKPKKKKRKSEPKVQRLSKKVRTSKRITDHKTAYSKPGISGQHVDIKVTPPGPRGKPGIVLVEVYNRSKIYLQTVRFEIELNNNGWDRLSQTITVDSMEAGGSTMRELKLPGKTSKSAAYSIKDVSIKRIDMYSYDATPVKLSYNTDLILR